MYGILTLTALVGVGLRLAVSACERTAERASRLVPIILLPVIIIGGALLPINKMFWSTATHIIPSRWAYEAMLLTEAALAMRERLVERGLPIVLDETNTTCCFAVQDKVWVVDPNGYRWEVFVVHQDNLPQEAEPQVSACCVTGQPEMVKIGGVGR